MGKLLNLVFFIDNDDIIKKKLSFNSSYLLDQSWFNEDQASRPARMPVSKPRSSQPPSKDDNIFKIPTAMPPVSPRQSSPKSNEFLSKVAAKSADPPKPNSGTMFNSSIFNNAIQSSISQKPVSQPSSSNIFGSKVGNNAPSDGGFSLTGNFQFGDRPTVNNFRNTQQRETHLDVTDSKNTLINSAAFTNNLFQMSTKKAQPLAESSGLFSSGFGNAQPNPKPNSSIFSRLGKPSTEQEDSRPNATETSLFGNFRSESATTGGDAAKSSIFGTINSGQTGQTSGGFFIQTSTARPDVFGGAPNFPQNPATVASFGGFKGQTSLVAGIAPLGQKDEEREKAALKEKKRLEEQRQKEKEEERIRAEKKRVEEEKERQRIEAKRVKAEAEKKARLEKLSSEMCDDILENFINKEFLIEIAAEEIEKYKALEKKVNEIYESLLSESITDKLKQITVATMNQNVMQKYFQIWRKTAREQIENRRKIEMTPIWMPTKSIPEQIPELRHPLQQTTLNFMKRYRLGVPTKLVIPHIKRDSINIWSIATPELIRSVTKHQRNALIKSQVYWKCVISVPDSNEEGGPDGMGINKWLNNLFVRQSPRYDGSAFFLEQNVASHQNNQRINVCLRKLSGWELINEKGEKNCPADTQGTNGVLFFVSTGNMALARRRLQAIIQNTGVNDAIGIIMYSLGTSHPTQVRDALKPYDLLDAETIRRCFFSDAAHESLCKITENCLQYVTSISQYDYRLEMQQTPSFLKLSLGDEFWQRIASTTSQNPSLSRAITKFGFVANFYNEALRRLTKICSHSIEANMEFSEELRKLVPDNQLDIPLDLEYFPANWQSTCKKHQAQLVGFLKTLKVKSFSIEDITDISTLEKRILTFAQSHIESERDAYQTGYKMFQQILLYLNESNNENYTFQEKLTAYSWLKALQIFTLDVLSFRYHQYLSKSRLPTHIIYDKEELAAFTRTPWWLTLNGQLLKEITTDVLNESNGSLSDIEGSPIVKKRKLDDASSPGGNACGAEKMDIDALLAKGKETLEKADRKITTFNTIQKNSKEVTKGFDYMLYKQEQAMRVMRNVWGQNLKN